MYTLRPLGMRVLLPLTQDRRGGIGRVAVTLARALPDALRPDDRLVVAGELPGAAGHPQVIEHRRAPPRNGLQRLAREQLELPRLAASADLIHLSDHRPVLGSRTPFVMTVHDVSFADHPDWYPRRIHLYKTAMLRAALAKRPAAVVTVSEWSMERLCEVARLPAGTVRRVISPGVEPLERPPSPAEAPGEPYFLTVSAIEPRKNHLGLLDAFTRARAEGLRLRWKVVGRPLYRGEEIAERLRAAPGVDLLGSLSQDELERAFAAAEFVATPSWEEGFGYPPLEAMLRGVPALCSTGSALDESVGDAALRVDPADADAWAHALLRMQDDGELRAALMSRARERLTRFAPAATARAHVELFHELAG
jgi:glycosyltransferase involved in cell wall biosynthesis